MLHFQLRRPEGDGVRFHVLVLLSVQHVSQGQHPGAAEHVAEVSLRQGGDLPHAGRAHTEREILDAGPHTLAALIRVGVHPHLAVQAFEEGCGVRAGQALHVEVQPQLPDDSPGRGRVEFTLDDQEAAGLPVPGVAPSGRAVAGNHDGVLAARRAVHAPLEVHDAPGGAPDGEDQVIPEGGDVEFTGGPQAPPGEVLRGRVVLVQGGEPPAECLGVPVRDRAEVGQCLLRECEDVHGGFLGRGAGREALIGRAREAEEFRPGVRAAEAEADQEGVGGTAPGVAPALLPHPRSGAVAPDAEAGVGFLHAGAGIMDGAALGAEAPGGRCAAVRGNQGAQVAGIDGCGETHTPPVAQPPGWATPAGFSGAGCAGMSGRVW